MESRTEYRTFGQFGFTIAGSGGQADVQPALYEPGKLGMPNLERIAAGKNNAKWRERAAGEQFANGVDHALILSPHAIGGNLRPMT